MPLVPEADLKLATQNIAHFGDTDIFPFPTENHIFYDKSEGVCTVLKEIDRGFESALITMPVLASKELAAVGYNGFRQGTQIDPIWNAYLLALVVCIGKDIEARRVSSSIVFSYRFKPVQATGSLFDTTVGWVEFQAEASRKARKHAFVLRCDISDFYPRIYHHRLENALRRATENSEAVKRISRLVSAIADGPSYGLPVGGPAARLLSELLLNSVDRLLLAEKINFIRFVDDYLIFADSREQAHSSLIRLSQLLLTNEGLSLQKTKSRIQSSAEFLATSEFTEAGVVGEASENDLLARAFKRLRIRYDPYSPTADNDYKTLTKELSRFDIVGMLGRELTKSRIDESLTRRLVSSIRLLPESSQNDAMRSMFDSLDLLYPIFPSVMQLCRHLHANLTPDVQTDVYASLRHLIECGSYITQVPANLAYAIRVLANNDSEETETLFATLYKDSSSMMIRRDLIILMAFRKADYWLSNCRNSFATLNGWERRALLIASYTLGDEGKHWRGAIRNEQSAYDKLVLEWTSESKQKHGYAWRVPL